MLPGGNLASAVFSTAAFVSVFRHKSQSVGGSERCSPHRYLQAQRSSDSMYKAWEWQRGGFGKPHVYEHHVLQQAQEIRFAPWSVACCMTYRDEEGR